MLNVFLEQAAIFMSFCILKQTECELVLKSVLVCCWHVWILLTVVITTIHACTRGPSISTQLHLGLYSHCKWPVVLFLSPFCSDHSRSSDNQGMGGSVTGCD